MKSLEPPLRKNEVERLKNLFNSTKISLKFLAYEIDLTSTEISDSLKGKSLLEKKEKQILWILLSHLSRAEPREKTGKLISFRDLPGGYAYDSAFRRKAVEPISETFGNEPTRLIEAGKVLGGRVRNLGDFSVEIPSLAAISLTYILWVQDEFPSSAKVLFDESASHFLPTEDLAVLAEITTTRLQTANSSLRREDPAKSF